MAATVDRPRRWWLAALASLVLPGWGQLYNGRIARGAAFYLVNVALYAGFIFAAVKGRSRALFIAALSLYVAAYLLIMFEAALGAKRTGGGRPIMAISPVIKYGLVVAGLALLLLVRTGIRDEVATVFRMSASSMEPALLDGDIFFVDKLAGASKEHARGDVIVFEYPKEPRKLFVKRVVGLPGETVEVVEKRVHVDGRKLDEAYASYRDARVLARGESPRDNYGPVTVPAGSYFVMGDSRDNAYDSRYWGFLGRHGIIGEARTVFLSWDRNQKRPRLERTGKKIDHGD